MAEQSRERLKTLWDKYRFPIAFVLIGIGVIVGRLIYSPQIWEMGMSLYTSVLNVAATVLILDELNRRRSKRDAEAELKRQLIDDAASNVNDVASNAVHQLRRKGWLEGENGLLKCAKLQWANLQEADLHDANLRDAGLSWANLQEAQLYSANLQGAYLTGARLHGANLRNANLRGATLLDTYLQGADLHSANLQGAPWRGAKFDELTILPDDAQEAPSRWTEDTDMRRFTDPEHPNFWRSEDYMSPAWSGLDEK